MIVANTAQPVGVFDSGVGGLTVVNKLRHLLPHEDIVYLGDTRRNPYGIRTREEILSFTREIIAFLAGQHVKLIAFACNTATATAYDTVVNETDIPLLGMSRGIKTAKDTTTEKRIAVFATPLTIANHIHKKEAEKTDPFLTIVEQPCASLAGLIERGKLDGPEIREAVRDDVAPVLKARVDTAIFGCTHYPFVRHIFEEFCGESVVFVDPAHETALQTLAVLKKKNLLNTQRRPGYLHLCFTAEAGRGAALASELISPEEFTAAEVSLT